jgi:sulfur-oxidizing protein SoxZ
MTTMAAVKTRVKTPRSARIGEVVTIKTLVSHPMETGRREARDGSIVPRRIINRFSATFNGEAVVSADLGTAVSANPYFEFRLRVPGPGTLAFAWVDDDGSVYTEEREIAVG